MVLLCALRGKDTGGKNDRDEDVEEGSPMKLASESMGRWRDSLAG